MKCGLGGFPHEQLHQEAMKFDARAIFARQSYRQLCCPSRLDDDLPFRGCQVSLNKQLHQEAMSQVQSLPERGISLIIINFQ
ncbi:MAG: hypothetical protein AAFV28_12105 [Cyanobacteria bacterium J06635_13]